MLFLCRKYDDMFFQELGKKSALVSSSECTAVNSLLLVLSFPLAASDTVSICTDLKNGLWSADSASCFVKTVF